jgi:hypothetical protein
MTRAEFASTNALFRRACQLAGLTPSRHQAKRWRKNQGTAWAFVDVAKESLLTPEQKRARDNELARKRTLERVAWLT